MCQNRPYFALFDDIAPIFWDFSLTSLSKFKCVCRIKKHVNARQEEDETSWRACSFVPTNKGTFHIVHRPQRENSNHQRVHLVSRMHYFFKPRDTLNYAASEPKMRFMNKLKLASNQ